MTESNTSYVSDVICHSLGRFNVRIIQSLTMFRNKRNSCQFFRLSTFDKLTIDCNKFWWNWTWLGFKVVCCGRLLHEFFPVWWRLLNSFYFWSICFFNFRSLLLLFLDFELFDFLLPFFKFDFWNWDLLLFFQLSLLNFNIGRFFIFVIFLVFLVVFLILFIFLINFFEFEAIFGDEAEYFRVLWDLLLDIDLIFWSSMIFVLEIIEIIMTGIFLIL